ncbi:MAG: alpha/beta hydrolase [Paracoccaceae bacterium]|nr:alpha/beta hydrolase [Paracoccaceae bacterium]MDE2915308.1 alpha/beta hydrolase [Paracoccaceae bacterium]
MTEAAWEIPEPLSTFDVRVDKHTVISVRRYGNPSGSRIVLSHGNGLAVDLYYPFWSLLSDDFDLMVYDLRNHGRNAVGIQRDHNIPTLIADHDLILDAIVRKYGEKPTVGVFHSLATLVTLLSFNNLYSALILFDPPLCKPAASEAEFDAAAERAAAFARRRTDRFKSEQQFVEVLSFVPGLDRVGPGVRELMARSTLRRSSDGKAYELRCPRDYEAQIAEYVRSFSPLLDLTMLTCPTKVIGADPTLPYAYLPTFDLSHASAVDYDFVPEATHFLQLEQPEHCAGMVREYLASHGIQ